MLLVKLSSYIIGGDAGTRIQLLVSYSTVQYSTSQVILSLSLSLCSSLFGWGEAGPALVTRAHFWVEVQDERCSVCSGQWMLSGTQHTITDRSDNISSAHLSMSMYLVLDGWAKT